MNNQTHVIFFFLAATFFLSIVVRGRLQAYFNVLVGPQQQSA